MSHPQSPKPCAYYCGFIWSRRERLEACVEQSEALWGPVLDRSEDFEFAETAYYHSEMGPGLRRTYYLYRTLLADPSTLIERKHQAARFEEASQEEGRRAVNLDPGYFNGHQLVIATFKDYAHRIYLGRGVYAHLEYLFRNGEPVLLPWTYPDFRRPDHLALFRGWRSRHLHLIARAGQ